MMTDIRSMNLSELTEYLTENGFEKFRAKQVLSWFRQDVSSFDEMTNLPARLRAFLKENAYLAKADIVRTRRSAIDDTVKYLFELYDGEYVEGVLMRYHHGLSVCISTQVGCKMGCTFCATGKSGFSRSLTASEMIAQIRSAETDAGERISNVVLMGMGEPFDNYDNVIKFLRLVNHPDGLNIGYRHISLSTCGLVDGIRRLAGEGLPITLSVSLHAPTDEARSEIMPVNRRYPIAELMGACCDYFTATGRRISFEYTLIAGKNDTAADAARLADLLRATVGRDGAPVHVNLIRANEVKETGFSGTSVAAANAFAERLNRRGLTATVRRRLGSDVNAACGQLRRTHKARTEA